MCGITGIVNINKGINRQAEIIKKMTDAIRHRGPDDEGYVLFGQKKEEILIFYGDDTPELIKNGLINYQSINVSNTFDIESKIAFGYRRLSILDLSHRGHQPMQYSNRYWIIFNGEIYNYIELRNELKDYGYNFNSDSDTEVIMAAYDRWGIECLNKFNGMWAFVIYDTQTEKLFISRDRFGVKPLYYYIDENKFLFASEIKSLLRHPDIMTEPNIRNIKDYLQNGPKEYIKETIFKNIYRFNFGSYLILDVNDISLDKIKEQKFYKIVLSPIDNVEFSLEQAELYAKQYYNLFKDAVKLRLRSDVKIGSALSGGLDSSSIVFMVNQELKEKGKTDIQETFSSVYKTQETYYCDESKFIKKITDKFNVKSTQIEPKAENIFKEHIKMIYHLESPPANSLMSSWHTFKCVSESDVTVTLDGQGADEQQGGYIRYLTNYFTYLNINTLFKEYNNFIKVPRAKKFIKSGIFFNVLSKFGLKKIILKILKVFKYDISPFEELNERLKKEIFTNLINLLHYSDKTSMAFSIESRMPFMDYRLMEFWLNLPQSYKINNGYTKYISRLAMNGKLPEEITWRKDKMGWEIPEFYWFKGVLKNKFCEIIEKSELIKKINPDFNIYEEINNTNINTLMLYFNIAVWNNIFFNNKN